MRYAAAVMLLLMSTLGSAQAQSGAYTDSTSGSSIKIDRITPSISQSLHAGDKVRFEVEVSYLVVADSAIVGLIIQRGDPTDNPVLSFTTDIAPKGSGKLKMATDVVIPETKVVHVFTPLSHQGDSRTSVVDMRSYKVTTAPKE